MKSKVLKTVSIIQAFVLMVGMCVFSVPLKASADYSVLPIAVSDSYKSSVYYERACAAYSSYSDPATRFVQVALSQAGYKGGTYYGAWAGNGGGGEYTEYGRFMGADNDDWCASFVSWCAAAAGIPTNTIPRAVGAGYWRSPAAGTYTPLWSNNFTTYNDYKPQVGDLALYMPYCTTCGGHYNATNPTSHVVIVASVSNTKNADGSWSFTTIERGNGNVVSSNPLTTKQTRGWNYTCSCGKQAPSNQSSYVVQGFFRPNWSNAGYNAYLDPCGGSCGTSRISLTYGGYIGNLPTPIRDGFTFNGWYSEKNGNGVKHTSDMVFWGLSDVTWYASWTANGNVDIASGSFDSINWRIDANNNLFFEGTGVINQRVVSAKDYTINAIYIGEGITGVGENIFNFNAEDLESISLPSTLKEIGAWSFANNYSLKNVNLPEGLESIGAGAFSGVALERIEIPDTVTEIGRSAFSGNLMLKSVKLPANLTAINNSVFTSCTVLENIELPKTVETIGNSAFNGCKALKSVSIPETVTSIGLYAFKNCTNLTDVYLSVTESEWKNNVVVGEEAFSDTVTFHFKESVLNFEVIENESNTVTLSWNQDEYSYAYDVIIYDEVGLLLESRRVSAEDAVDGVLKTTFNLHGGNYKAEIACLNAEGIIVTDEISFTVEMTDADNYSIDTLYGSVSEGRFYASVDVENLTDRKVADTVVIAVYKDGEMIDFVYMKADLPQGQTVTFGGMLEGCEGATLKAFVWDSIQGMKSLSNVVEK